MVGTLFCGQNYTTFTSDVWNPGVFLEKCGSHHSEDFPIFFILQALELTSRYYKEKIIEFYGILDAVSLCLEDFFKFHSSDYDEFLTTLETIGGFSNHLSKDELKEKLNIAIIKEITSKEDQYRTLMATDVKIESMSSSLAADEELLSHKLVGCVLQAIANLLNVVIVIISSCIGLPFLPVIPFEGGKAFNKNPTFFLYYQTNENKFIPLVEISSTDETTNCTCGSKDKIKKARCTGDPRCKCIKRNVTCNRYIFFFFSGLMF